MTATKKTLTHHQARAIKVGTILEFDSEFDSGDPKAKRSFGDWGIFRALVIDNDVRENGTLQILVHEGRHKHTVQWIDYRAVTSLHTQSVWQLVAEFDNDAQNSWVPN